MQVASASDSADDPISPAALARLLFSIEITLLSACERHHGRIPADDARALRSRIETMGALLETTIDEAIKSGRASIGRGTDAVAMVRRHIASLIDQVEIAADLPADPDTPHTMTLAVSYRFLREYVEAIPAMVRCSTHEIDEQVATWLQEPSEQWRNFQPKVEALAERAVFNLMRLRRDVEVAAALEIPSLKERLAADEACRDALVGFGIDIGIAARVIAAVRGHAVPHMKFTG